MIMIMGGKASPGMSIGAKAGRQGEIELMGKSIAIGNHHAVMEENIMMTAEEKEVDMKAPGIHVVGISSFVRSSNGQMFS